MQSRPATRAWLWTFFVAGGALAGPTCSRAQAETSATEPAESASVVSSELVEYDVGFFLRYQPNTALDMVNQLPGFVLDDGGDSRGFAASTGNILINDRRPSSKQDLPSLILARIPAVQVQSIEVIRGQVREIDLQGQAVVANVILKDIVEAAVRWRGLYRYNIDFGPTAEFAMSRSDRLGSIDYNTGFDLQDYSRGDYTPQSILDGQGDLTQSRYDVGETGGFQASASVSAAAGLGATLLRLNLQVAQEDRDGVRDSVRTPASPAGPATLEAFPATLDALDIELGFDAERSFGSTLLGKAILLYVDSDQNTVSTQISYDEDRVQTRERVSDTDTLTAETIGRIELNWTRWQNHVLQLNVETALNSLDNTLQQTDDTGEGPVIIDVPGANSRVEEIRGDILLKDTWTLADLELEYGLGFEVSTIEQTGDVELKRDFSFAKPQVALTYAPYPRQQTRLRVAREVSQLDFNNFVSATIFEDDDIEGGNPDLRPETTWRLELSHERRFGRESVVKLLAFNDWVSDVEDLLPLSQTLEAPGNIGDGRRWGIELEGTLPLDRLGLDGAKLDVIARWQDSSVVDPVTGNDRVFSAGARIPRLLPLEYRLDTEFAYAIDFRQDIPAARFAWGWDVRSRAERVNFKVNELVIEDEETEINVFVETTRWFGLKASLAAQNILDVAETRDRILFVGERDLTPVGRREFRSRERGFRVSFEVSGSF